MRPLKIKEDMSKPISSRGKQMLESDNGRAISWEWDSMSNQNLELGSGQPTGLVELLRERCWNMSKFEVMLMA